MDKGEELREAIRLALERMTGKLTDRTVSEAKRLMEKTCAAEEKQERSRRVKFATYCALTCIGGSERKQCPCERPGDCHMREEPGFQRARREAVARMQRLLVRSIPVVNEDPDGEF